MNEEDAVRAWRRVLALHATAACALERELSDRHRLGMSEFEVLERMVEGGQEKYRVQEVADAVHLSQSACSRLIARLEKAGLVTRAICQDDRRGIYVGITSEGRERHATARPTHRAVIGEIFAPAAYGEDGIPGRARSAAGVPGACGSPPARPRPVGDEGPGRAGDTGTAPGGGEPRGPGDAEGRVQAVTRSITRGSRAASAASATA